MKCNIEYIGKLRNGRPQYYCQTHKFIASDKLGNKLTECLCNYKEVFDNVLDAKNDEISNIKIIYENILENVIPKIMINNKEFNGVINYDNSVLTYKDLGGIMLSKLNDIKLEEVKCSHCGHYHSDNGKYAYTPHRTHLCLYCGHLFRVKERNIGNEFSLIYNIPKIELENKTINIVSNCRVEYDLFSSELLVNGQNVNNIIINNKTISLIEFLNKQLETSY